MQKTALYDGHVAHQGMMVDFAGWSMPLHFGSQLKEHQMVREHAGVFDVSHMTIVDIEGDDATAYLRMMLANDVFKLKEDGAALYSCMLNEEGGVIDDLIVYRQPKGNYRMVVNAATRDKDMAWLAKYSGGYDIVITERTDLSMLAVQGPLAREKTLPCLPQALQPLVADLKVFRSAHLGDWFVARTGYTGEDGYEIILPNSAAAEFYESILHAGIAPCGLGARDTLRIEAGLNLYGTDMDESVTPLASNLAWTVAFSPEERKFIGKEALIDQKASGHPRLVGLVLQDKGVPRGHQQVYVGDDCIGEITSGTFSPSLNCGIAFARIKAADINSCEIAVRQRKLAAKVVRLPFIRRGQPTF